MKKIFITLLLILSSITSVYAGDIFLKNEYYREGKPGFAEFVRLQTTDNANYNRFVNGRFAYSIYVPSEFTIARFPANSAGCSFSDEYGSSFAVYGQHNVLRETIDHAYYEALSKHPNPAVSAKGQEWFVISYLEDGFIVYEKTFINADFINAWSFRYPQWLGERYNPKCEVVESNFVPGWKTGYKIWG